jgi:phenolic acid decarboxylase
MIDVLEKKHGILVTEFGRYVVEHPEFTEKFPQNAQIVLQVEGDEEYNRWSKELSDRQREAGQAVVYVKVKGLRPVKSRLIEPEVALR